MDSFVMFSGHEEIVEFVSKYKREADKKYVKGPEVIEIRNLKSNDDIYLLSELPLSHVTTVCFRDCQFHAPSHHKIFKHGGFLSNVENWEFFGCNLTKDILKTFFINKHTKPVKSIVVEPLDDGVELFKTLIKWKKLMHIKRFAFIGSKIGKDNLDALLASPMFGNLEHIDLSHTKLYDEGFSDFVSRFNNHKIRGFYIQNTGISEKMVVSLLKNKAFAKLEVLDVSNNFGMNAAVREVADSKTINGLRELYLRNTYLNIESLYNLVCSSNFGSIARLDLSNNFSIKDDFAVAMIDKPFVRQLSYLNLDNCDVSNESIRHLSDNRHLKNLTELDISNNPKVNINGLLEDAENIKFFSNLKILYVANLGLDAALIRDLQDEFKVKVDTQPHVFKDYSDYLQHIKEPQSSTPLDETQQVSARTLGE